MCLSRLGANKLVIASLICLLCNIVACRTQQSRNADSHPEIFAPDHIQYFPDGPEFKLSREAAQLKAARAAEKLKADSHGDSTATDSIEIDEKPYRAPEPSLRGFTNGQSTFPAR